MFAEERQSRILSLVNASHSISAVDIQRALSVSRETVRRDLQTLADRRKLRRTHGGAMSLETAEPEIAARQVINAEGKRAIGRLAASMIPDGAALFLAGGTTVQSVSDELTARRELTVVTNCVASCVKLSGRNGNRVYMLGGELQPRNQTTLGRDATDMLSRYVADFAIVGAGGISREGQIMDFSREEAELYGLMMRSAESVIIVADHQKLGRVAPVRVEGLDKVACLVTDVDPASEMAKMLGRLPLRILVANKST